MTQLGDVVARYAAPPGKAGGVASAGFDRKGLQAELARLRTAREIWFWVVGACALAVFVGALIFIVAHSEDTAAITKLATASGVTVTGALAAMTKLWQDRVRADLVLALASGMTEEGLREALLKLIERF